MSIKSPVAVLYNISGSELAIIKDAPLTGNQPTLPIAGSDGSFIRLLKTAGDGTLFITGSFAATFTPPPVTLVSGSVSVYTQGPQAVSGTVTVTVTSSLPVTGNVAITNVVPITGAIDVAHLYGYDDLGNSSTTPLGNNATFTGTAFDTLNYSSFVCLIATNKKSAVGGIQFQWSNDGTNWDLVRASTMENDDEARGFHVAHQGRYFRLVYVNGNSPQGFFRLDVIHRPSAPGLITRPLIDVVDDDNFALLVRAVLSAKNNQGNYINVAATQNGNLKVAIEEFDAPIIANITSSVQVYTSGPQNVTGSVAVYTQGAQLVSGSVAVFTQGPQAVSGTVGVNNFPEVQAVSGSQLSGSTFAGSPVVVGGTYASGNYVKAVQVDISGALYITTSGSLPVTGGIQVLNQVTVTGSVLALPSGIQQVSGSLAVDNVVRVTTTGSLPVHVDSQIQVSNFPTVQAVSGSVSVFTQGPQQVTGSVAVYTQGAQAVTGSVNTYTQGPQLVSGTLIVTGAYQSGSVATAPIFPVLAGGVDQDNTVRPVRLDPQGRSTNQALTGSVTTVNGNNNINFTLLAANPQRVMALIFNEGGPVLYLKFGISASVTSYSVQVASKGYYEVPAAYAGRLDAVFGANNGVARVTELT